MTIRDIVAFVLGLMASIFIQILAETLVNWFKKQSLIRNFKKEIELNILLVAQYLTNLDILKDFIARNEQGVMSACVSPTSFKTFGVKLLEAGYLYEKYEPKEIEHLNIALSLCNGNIITNNVLIQAWFNALSTGTVSDIEFHNDLDKMSYIEGLRQQSLKTISSEIDIFHTVKQIFEKSKERF